MSGLALDLARDGVGVALGQRMLAADDIAAGPARRPCRISPCRLATPYSLVLPLSKARKTGLTAACRLARSEAK